MSHLKELNKWIKNKKNHTQEIFCSEDIGDDDGDDDDELLLWYGRPTKGA